MRVCLINPPWFTKQGNIWHSVRSTMPPLGLLYLASFLEKERIDIEVIDFQASFKSWEDVERIIKYRQYDFYGITSTTAIINNAYRVSRIIKTYHPEAKIIFGGVHVTALPEEALANKEIDFVVRGEGEETLLRLVKGDPLQAISGLSYRKDKSIIHNKPDGLVEDLDDLTFPAFHKINLKLYHPAVGSYKRLPAINMLTTRGCIGKCSFCNSAHIPLRVRSADNIFQEMKMLYEKYGIREISFYDDIFTVQPKNIEQLCDLLIGHKIDLTWSCFARTDCVTPPLLKKMKAAGCHQIMYGIETASSQILQKINKGIDQSKNKTAIELTKEAGIEVRCTFMFGNPGETVETLDDTIRYSIELDPDIALYNITTPYPGTAMFDWAKNNGYLMHQRWDDYDLGNPVMSLPTVLTPLVKKKYKEAFKKFYLRPRFIIKKIINVLLLREIPMVWEEAQAFLNFLKPQFFER